MWIEGEKLYTVEDQEGGNCTHFDDEDQAKKLSLERNGGYTWPKGPFHPVEGQGSTILSQVRRALGQPGRRSCFHKGSSTAVHITAELVPISLFIQWCTLYNLTDFLAWLKPRQIQLHLSWIRQNVVFN